MTTIISHRLQYSICWVVSLFLIISTETFAARPKRANVSRKGKKDSNSHYSYGFYLLLFVLALSIVPAIFSFCYSIYKDPLMPDILQRGLQLLQEKTMSYLSNTKSNENKYEQNNESNTRTYYDSSLEERDDEGVTNGTGLYGRSSNFNATPPSLNNRYTNKPLVNRGL